MNLYLLNTILGLLYIGVALGLLVRLAIRNSRRPVQKWAEKEWKPTSGPVTHREVAFRATIHTNPVTKLR